MLASGMTSGRTSYSQAPGAFDQASILASLSDDVSGLQVMRLLARIGEHGAPAAANELLGAPATTVEAWCHAQLPASEATGG